MSKRCGVCGTKYLNDAALDHYETNCSSGRDDSPILENEDIMDDKIQAQTDSSQDESDILMNKRRSVARILLAACDTCGLCGGKFID